jgi:hypothetical protein
MAHPINVDRTPINYCRWSTLVKDNTKSIQQQSVISSKHNLPELINASSSEYVSSSSSHVGATDGDLNWMTAALLRTLNQNVDKCCYIMLHMLFSHIPIPLVLFEIKVCRDNGYWEWLQWPLPQIGCLAAVEPKELEEDSETYSVAIYK